MRTVLATVGMLALVAPVSSAPLPAFEMDKLPYRATWGPYSLLVDRKAGEKEADFAPQFLRLTDSSGRVVKEIRDSKIAGVEIEEVTGKGTPELYVMGYSGGAHCCYTEYYFTRDSGTVRNLLVFDGANGTIYGRKDLNGDGRRELIAQNDALAYFDGIAYAVSPQFTMILGWNGTRYVDQSRKYPQRNRQEALNFRNQLWMIRNSKEDLSEEERRAFGVGYYGSLAAIGEESHAAAWLKKYAPRPARDWVLQRATKVRQTVRNASGKIRVNQAKVLGTWD